MNDADRNAHFYYLLICKPHLFILILQMSKTPHNYQPDVVARDKLTFSCKIPTFDNHPCHVAPSHHSLFSASSSSSSSSSSAECDEMLSSPPKSPSILGMNKQLSPQRRAFSAIGSHYLSQNAPLRDNRADHPGPGHTASPAKAQALSVHSTSCPNQPISSVAQYMTLCLHTRQNAQQLNNASLLDALLRCVRSLSCCHDVSSSSPSTQCDTAVMPKVTCQAPFPLPQRLSPDSFTLSALPWDFHPSLRYEQLAQACIYAFDDAQDGSSCAQPSQQQQLPDISVISQVLFSMDDPTLDETEILLHTPVSMHGQDVFPANVGVASDSTSTESPPNNTVQPALPCDRKTVAPVHHILLVAIQACDAGLAWIWYSVEHLERQLYPNPVIQVSSTELSLQPQNDHLSLRDCYEAMLWLNISKARALTRLGHYNAALETLYEACRAMAQLVQEQRQSASSSSASSSTGGDSSFEFRQDQLQSNWAWFMSLGVEELQRLLLWLRRVCVLGSQLPCPSSLEYYHRQQQQQSASPTISTRPSSSTDTTTTTVVPNMEDFPIGPPQSFDALHATMPQLFPHLPCQTFPRCKQGHQPVSASVGFPPDESRYHDLCDVWRYVHYAALFAVCEHSLAIKANLQIPAVIKCVFPSLCCDHIPSEYRRFLLHGEHVDEDMDVNDATNLLSVVASHGGGGGSPGGGDTTLATEPPIASSSLSDDYAVQYIAACDDHNEEQERNDDTLPAVSDHHSVTNPMFEIAPTFSTNSLLAPRGSAGVLSVSTKKQSSTAQHNDIRKEIHDIFGSDTDDSFDEPWSHQIPPTKTSCKPKSARVPLSSSSSRQAAGVGVKSRRNIQRPPSRAKITPNYKVDVQNEDFDALAKDFAKFIDML